MKSAFDRACELIQSIADHADPVAEMRSIVAAAPDDERFHVSLLWEAFWLAHQLAKPGEWPDDHD
ncbi:MAG: hypothetical protein LBE86_10530 [Gemmobacter sp.]|jgi:hypothetical protein|nr:hypothetical protein [Gemmobacter sp.]